MNKPPSFEMMHNGDSYKIEFTRGGKDMPWWTVLVNDEIFASAKREEQNNWMVMRGASGRYYGRTAEEAVIQCVKGEIKKK